MAAENKWFSWWPYLSVAVSLVKTTNCGLELRCRSIAYSRESFQNTANLLATEIACSVAGQVLPILRLLLIELLVATINHIVAMK